MERFQARGREHYRRAEYSKAIECFNRALGFGQTVQLFDNRATCHERLGNVVGALDDAKSAIRLQPQDPRGYVRAGRLLAVGERASSVDRRKKALQVYTIGLKRVQHVGRGYEVLQKLYDQTSEEVYPHKRIDPFTMLPNELAEIVLENLSFQQRVSACRVSKSWARLIYSMQSLWQHLDLSSARCKVKNSFISRAINVGRKKITVATLHKLQDTDTLKPLSQLLMRCQLTELTLRDNGLQSHALVDALSHARSLKVLRIQKGTVVRWTTLCAVAKVCSATLETLECANDSSPSGHSVQELICPNLKTLVLRDLSDNGARIESVARSLTTLRTLKLSRSYSPNASVVLDFSQHPSLEHLDLDNIGISYAKDLALPPSLRTLAFRWRRSTAKRFGTFTNSFTNAVDLVQFRLPLLEELTLDLPGQDLDIACLFLAVRTVRPDLARSPINDQPGPLSKLRRLSIQCTQFSGQGFDELISHPRLDELLYLKLQHYEIHDKRVAFILDKIPTLESWDLSGTSITGVGVKEIVSQGQAKSLTLNECLNLSKDAVEWARDQGVHVQNWKMVEWSGSSTRKIMW